VHEKKRHQEAKRCFASGKLWQSQRVKQKRGKGCLEQPTKDNAEEITDLWCKE
jgi:hypothetical protein